MMSSDDKKPTLLVTVGSTLFPNLTFSILTTESLDSLSSHVSALRIQIGKGDIPVDLASQIVVTGSPAGGMRGTYGDMEVDVLRYTDDFEGLVSSVDLVVSHAGTSSPSPVALPWPTGLTTAQAQDQS